MALHDMVTYDLSRHAIADHLRRSVKMVFSKMVAMELEIDYPLQEPVTYFTCSVSAMVGLAGKCSGLVGLHVPHELARVVTAGLLGLDTGEIADEDVDDAIGELTNIVAGEMKILFATSVGALSLSTPSIIAGKEYTIQVISDSSAIVVPFECDGHRVVASVQIEV